MIGTRFQVGDKIPFAEKKYEISQIFKQGDQDGTIILVVEGETPKIGNIVPVSEAWLRDYMLEVTL